MKRTLLRPLEKYNEMPLLLFGIIMTALGSFAASLLNARFSGVIDMNITKHVKPVQPFLDNAANTLALFIFLFALGKYINSKTRAIDILNSILIARIPFYLLPLFNIGSLFSSIETKVNPANPYAIDFTAGEMVLLFFFAIIAITCLVWFVMLLYNGFKVASNSKTTTHKSLFALAVVLAWAFSKYLIYLIS